MVFKSKEHYKRVSHIFKDCTALQTVTPTVSFWVVAFFFFGLFLFLIPPRWFYAVDLNTAHWESDVTLLPAVSSRGITLLQPVPCTPRPAAACH